MHDPAREIQHPLTTLGQQRDQQRSTARVQVGGPHHRIPTGQRKHRGDQLKQRGFVVALMCLTRVGTRNISCSLHRYGSPFAES
jgi:hypothetical protein